MEDDEQEKGGGVPAWIVGYADLMTLLFATFVVLYGKTPEGVTKAFTGSKSEVIHGVQDVLEEFKIKLERGDGILGKEKSRKEAGNTPPPEKQPIKGNSEYPVRIIKQDFEAMLNTLTPQNRKIRAKGAKTSTFEVISIASSKNELTISLRGSAFYKRESSRLDREALKAIEPIIQKVTELGRTISFIGHTSKEMHIKGLAAVELSVDRASALANYVVSKFKYPSTKVTAAGFGGEMPIKEWGNDDPNASDDRVDIHIDFSLNR
ncbi:MAG: OmpA family protein [Oligoflexales bacterium]|nr:OmpA family protein [Oligoflexales bacterium]